MTKQQYHYCGRLPITTTADNGMTFAIRNVNDATYIIWHGVISAGEPASGPIAFAEREDAEAWISDMAPLMPDGSYRVVPINITALIFATSSAFPTVLWTRQGDSYGYIPLATCLKGS